MIKLKQLRLKQMLKLLSITTISSYGVLALLVHVNDNKVVTTTVNLSKTPTTQSLKIVMPEKTKITALNTNRQVQQLVANVIMAHHQVKVNTTDYDLVILPTAATTEVLDKVPIKTKIIVKAKNHAVITGQMQLDAVITSEKIVLDKLAVPPMTITASIPTIAAFKTEVINHFNKKTINYLTAADVNIDQVNGQPLTLAMITEAASINLAISAKLTSLHVTGSTNIVVNIKANEDLATVKIAKQTISVTKHDSLATLKTNEELNAIITAALKKENIKVTTVAEYDITTEYIDSTQHTPPRISDGTEVKVTVTGKKNTSWQNLRNKFSFIVKVSRTTKTINGIIINDAALNGVPTMTIIKDDPKIHALIKNAIKTKHDINVENQQDYDIDVASSTNPANITVKALATSTKITGQFQFNIAIKTKLTANTSFNILDTTGIPDNTNINDMVKTNNGIYLATDKGVYYSNNSENSTYELIADTDNGAVEKIVATSDGTVYAALANDKIYEIKTKTITKTHSFSGTIQVLYVDINNNIYVKDSSKTKIWVKTKYEQTFSQLNPNDPDLPTYDLIIKDNVKYLSTIWGIYKWYDKDKIEKNDNIPGHTTNFASDSNNNIYVMDTQSWKIYCLINSEWKLICSFNRNNDLFNVPNDGYNTADVNTIEVDNEGNIYLASGKGVFRLNKNSQGEYDGTGTKVADFGGKVNKLKKDQDGNLYAVGTNGYFAINSLKLPDAIPTTSIVANTSDLEAYLKRELLFLFNQYLRLYTDYQIVDHDPSRQLITIKGIGKYHGIMLLKYEKIIVPQATFEVETKVKAQLLGYEPEELLRFEKRQRPQTDDQLQNFANGQSYEQWLIATAKLKLNADIAKIEAEVNQRLASNIKYTVTDLLLIFNMPRPETKAELDNFDDKGNSYEAWLNQKGEYLTYKL